MSEKREIVYSKMFQIKIGRFRWALDNRNIDLGLPHQFLNICSIRSQKSHFDIRMCFLESRYCCG